MRDPENGRKTVKRKRRRRGPAKSVFCLLCIIIFLLGLLTGKLVFARERETGKTEKKETVSDGTAGGYNTEDPVLSETEAAEDWMLRLVNASHPLDREYRPELEEIENNYYFDARAVQELRKMLSDGRKEGLDFWICSAYRTIEKQTELYENKVRRLEAEGMSHEKALERAAAEVTRPGTSEHHLGLAADIVARSYQILDEKQEETPEQQWLMKNCWKYGFILRYPTEKTEETGIIYEPWHYRYVGKEAAKEIWEKGICLEEYLEERYE